MDLGLKGKVAFVTASSAGIGRATAETLLTEGVKVAINGKSSTKLSEARHILAKQYGESEVETIQGDMADETVITDTCEYLKHKYGQIDILVANLGSGKPLVADKLDLHEWQRLLQINLYSVVWLMHEVQRLELLRKGSGTVIFMASLAAFDRIAAPPAYAAAKAGIVSLVKYLAPVLARDGIRINAVSPGNVYYEGGRWQEICEQDEDGTRRYIEAEVPMKRFAKPEEIASAVVFLCSGRSSFTTGTVVQIDGGQGRGY